MTKLFDENLGIASNSEELSKLKSKFYMFDPIYVAIATIAKRQKFRDWIESLWKQYEPYADRNFPKEFKTQFSHRAWELHVGSVLINHGYALERHTEVGPDFQLKYNTGYLGVEAISVTGGYGENKVPEIEYDGIVRDYPEKEILLRLTAGLVEKHKKYLNYLAQGYIAENDPYIIAINRSTLEHLDPQIPIILKCLFGIGYEQLTISRGLKKPRVKASNWSYRGEISKHNGTNIDMRLFNDQEYSGISAVIDCNYNLLNSYGDDKSLGHNFTIIHNPLAKNPIPINFFKFGEEWKQIENQLKKIRLRRATPPQ